jgi:hypothetical protein
MSGQNTSVLGERSVNLPTSSSHNRAPKGQPIGQKRAHAASAAPNWNCNQVRTRIRNFLNAGEMKIGEFTNALAVSPASYRRFMGQNGPYKGNGCDMYVAAHIFFAEKEMNGESWARARKSAKAKATEAAQGGNGARKTDDDSKFDVSCIHLDGEEADAVPIYDTCDDVRRKIEAHLRNPSVTQAAFLRSLIPPEGKATFQSAELSRFLGKKGARDGNATAIYYSAYVYFEKLRIKQGKAESEKRLEMKEIWAWQGGMDRDGQNTYICSAGKRPVQDNYGRVFVV